MRFPNILLTTALIAFGGAAFAQGYHGGHHGDELFHGVNLSDAQKSQMKTIEQAGWAQAKPTMEQVRAVHEQIMARLLAPGSVSEADLAPLVPQAEQRPADARRADAGAAGGRRRQAHGAGEPARSGACDRRQVVSQAGKQGLILS